MHNPPAAEGNFCDEHGSALKLQIVQGYNQHVGYFGKLQIYSFQWQELDKACYSHLVDIDIANSFLLPTLYDAKMEQNFPTWPSAKWLKMLGVLFYWQTSCHREKSSWLKVNFSIE